MPSRRLPSSREKAQYYCREIPISRTEVPALLIGSSSFIFTCALRELGFDYRVPVVPIVHIQALREEIHGRDCRDFRGTTSKDSSIDSKRRRQSPIQPIVSSVTAKRSCLVQNSRDMPPVSTDVVLTFESEIDR